MKKKYEVLHVVDKVKNIKKININQNHFIKTININKLNAHLKTHDYDFLYFNSCKNTNNSINNYIKLPKCKEIIYINLEVLNEIIIENLKILKLKHFYEEILLAAVIEEILKNDMSKFRVQDICEKIKRKASMKTNIKQIIDIVIRRNYAKSIIQNIKFYFTKKKIRQKFFYIIINNIRNDISYIERQLMNERKGKDNGKN